MGTTGTGEQGSRDRPMTGEQSNRGDPNSHRRTTTTTVSGPVVQGGPDIL